MSGSSGSRKRKLFSAQEQLAHDAANAATTDHDNGAEADTASTATTAVSTTTTTNNATAVAAARDETSAMPPPTAVTKRARMPHDDNNTATAATTTASSATAASATAVPLAPVGAGSVSELTAHTVFLRLTNTIRSPLVRRWCVAEWFYSTVDLPFFANNEFAAHVDALGPPYADATALTRAEWTAVRRRVGRPRRLSPAFLRQERERLAAHRRAIANMRQTGSLDESALAILRHVRLPPPLAARQRVVVADLAHARLSTGSILARTVDCLGYMVRFDDKAAEDQLVPAHAVMAYGERAPVSGQQQRFAYAPIQSVLTRSLGKVTLPTATPEVAAGGGGAGNGGGAAAAAVAGAGGAGGASGADNGAVDVGRRKLAVEKVRPLADLLYLLRRKELLLHELRHMNDLAQIAVTEQTAIDNADNADDADDDDSAPRAASPLEYDVRFRHEYAWLLAQLNQTDALLAPALSALEAHPMRQRVGSGKTRAANQSSWYAPLGAACSARANDVVQQALTAIAAADDDDGFEPETPVVELVAAAVSLLLHVVYCCESTMPQNETTLALFAASTSLRPHVPANQATFARIEEQLSRFKRAAFTAPLPPTPAHHQAPPARVPLLGMMASPQPVATKRKSAAAQH